jgi:hypothetical protein
MLPKLLSALESTVKAAQLCFIVYLALSAGLIGLSNRPLPPKGVGRGFILRLLLPLMSLLSAL